MSSLFKFSKSAKGKSDIKAPEDPPRRAPTDSSYYDCHGIINDTTDPNARAWHYARDVRAQVQAEKPRKAARGRKYPSYFANHGQEVPNLSMARPYMHVPIIPGQSKPSHAQGVAPGAHRAVYNDKRRARVDVIYHDPNKPIPPASRHRPFSKADYVPKASKAVTTQQPARL
ncbi:hypothetical protein ASPVEDRAFT_154010 [Aspergillus versicolor CBS 583.65]|uniref:Uncharacterized protein n=1 Tax=Aspergillus versicolor CBS 583.65 TaxID=1036611 RepID=A0A1L9PWF9_ASPVE|nr:uncharacterized protein ASPVEDRAFT_154010 [Aspergillus versicolor CBS 583.65]OJJ05868.1 hypothetical protein ASPVEDRAFT_154010 [Aspergillus versicolor CBS 583.65]